MIKEEVLDITKYLTIDYLINHPIDELLKSTLKDFRELQERMINLSQSKYGKVWESIKVVTVLLSGIVIEIVDRNHSEEYTKENGDGFENIISDESMDSELRGRGKNVFLIYANYIDISVATIESSMGKHVVKKTKQVKALSDEIRKKTEDFDKGILTETRYTDECLWISLEAMVKLLSTYAGKYTYKNTAVLLDDISQYAFEYVRLTLYRKEQALLEDILQHQIVIDAELKEKYDKYMIILNEKTTMFMSLIDNAFSLDIRGQIKGSVSLAKFIGVNETEILDSIDKIDDYFS